jgi:hypothetical protein
MLQRYYFFFATFQTRGGCSIALGTKGYAATPPGLKYCKKQKKLNYYFIFLQFYFKKIFFFSIFVKFNFYFYFLATFQSWWGRSIPFSTRGYASAPLSLKNFKILKNKFNWLRPR